MQVLRTRRIRTGAIVIVVSLLVIVTLASLTKDLHYGYGRDAKTMGWLERGIRLYSKGKPYIGGYEPDTYYRAYLQIKHILAFGMIGVGVGAVLLIVGLTTPRDSA